jgi:hypothetical protein
MPELNAEKTSNASTDLVYQGCNERGSDLAKRTPIYRISTA